MTRTPAVGSRWQHRNGNRYRVLALANTDSDNHEKYPPTVVYQGPNGKVWSRRLSDWERSFTALPPATEPSLTEGMNIAQRILHVGGRDTAGGYIEFGSIQAVEALVRQVLRDLSSELLALQSPESFEEWAVRQFAVPSVDHLKEKVYSHAFVAAMELAWNAAKLAQSDRLLELADALDEQLTSGAGTDMQDAYVGAREDLAIWKRRALEAERILRAEQPSPTPPAEQQAAPKAAPVTQQAGYAEVIECGNSYAKVKLKGEAFGSVRVGDIFYTALQQDEPVGEVVSASCDHATVRWLHQTSSVGGGDPRNSRAWPKVSGVSRDEGHSRALLVFFAAEPTDDEVRAVHDTLAAAPTAKAAPQQEA